MSGTRVCPCISPGTERPIRSSTVGSTSSERTVLWTRRPAGLAERRPDDERDASRGVIDEKTMCAFAVLVEAFTVVADGDDDRPAGKVAGVEPLKHSPELGIHKGDLAGVRLLLEARSIRFWRIVRRVSVVVMDPGEEGILAVFFKPRQRGIGDFVGSTRDVADRRGLVFRDVELVDIGVESLVQTPPPVEHERADKGAGLPAAIFQHACECHVLRIEHVATVVAHAVAWRQQPGEQSRVGR